MLVGPFGMQIYSSSWVKHFWNFTSAWWHECTGRTIFAMKATKLRLGMCIKMYSFARYSLVMWGVVCQTHTTPTESTENFAISYRRDENVREVQLLSFLCKTFKWSFCFLCSRRLCESFSRRLLQSAEGGWMLNSIQLFTLHLIMGRMTWCTREKKNCLEFAIAF